MEPNNEGTRVRVARLNALIKEGEQAVALGDMFKARDTFKQALVIDSQDPQALFALGSLYERMGNNPPGIMARQDLWIDAIKTYEKLMAVDSAHVESRVRAGYTHLRFGEFEGSGDKASEQFKKAAKRLDEALELDPKHAGAWYARGYAYLHENQTPAAITAFSKAVALDPKNIEAWWNIGILQEQQENYQAALDAFRAVSTLDPTREGVDDKVQKLLTRLEFQGTSRISTREDDVALTRLDTGMKLVKESNFPKALQFLSQALQHFNATGNITGQLEATRNIASAHKGLRNWNAAREVLLKTHALAMKKGDIQKQAEAAHNLG
jgi:tetratricopeptide (TPR) repeat protein